MLQYEFHANLERTARIVSVLDADLGLQLDVAGKKLLSWTKKAISSTTSLALP